MMSQIHCKQSIRIEKSGWFKHYFPGNLRRNILFKVCNYTSYQNLLLGIVVWGQKLEFDIEATFKGAR